MSLGEVKTVVHGYQMLEQGHGQPLVLLHGMLGEIENWQGVLSQAPADCRAIALHLPFFDGVYLSDVPSTQAYVRRFLDESNIDQVILGGNSFGGHVALRLALEMPDRVIGLVLTGSSGLFEREIGSHRGANPPREWYHMKMAEVFYDPARVTDALVDRVMEALDNRRCRRVLVSMAKSAKRDNLAAELPRVKCPTLLLWGKQDEITPPEVAEEFHQLLPNSELGWLDECGHAAMIEQPAAFSAAVQEWWSKYAFSSRDHHAPESVA